MVGLFFIKTSGNYLIYCTCPLCGKGSIVKLLLHSTEFSLDSVEELRGIKRGEGERGKEKLYQGFFLGGGESQILTYAVWQFLTIKVITTAPW